MLGEVVAAIHHRIPTTVRDVIIDNYYACIRASYIKKMKDWVKRVSLEEYKTYLDELAGPDKKQPFVSKKLRSFKEVGYNTKLEEEYQALSQKLTQAVIKKYPLLYPTLQFSQTRGSPKKGSTKPDLYQ
jgi:hypothetical protein